MAQPIWNQSTKRGTPEWREKIKLACLGRKSPMKGKRHTSKYGMTSNNYTQVTEYVGV